MKVIDIAGIALTSLVLINSVTGEFSDEDIDIQTEILNLKLTQQEEKINEMNRTITEQYRMIRQLSVTVSDLEPKVKQTLDKTSELDKSFTYTSNSLRHMTGDLAEKTTDLDRKIKTNYDTAVAFSAYASDRTVSRDSVVVYTNTDLNKGGHYSTNSGKFTCPVHGLYFFGAYASTSDHVAIDIKKSGSWYSGFFSNYDYSEDSSTGSSVVIECSSGQTVYMVCTAMPGKDCKINGGSKSVFTGALLIRLP